MTGEHFASEEVQEALVGTPLASCVPVHPGKLFNALNYQHYETDHQRSA